MFFTMRVYVMHKVLVRTQESSALYGAQVSHEVIYGYIEHKEIWSHMRDKGT